MLTAKNQNQGAKALITGGTIGIGLALAMGFAEEGYEVLSAVLGEMPENQDRIEFRSLDVRDQESIKQLVETRDHLDVMVNAAGTIRRKEELKSEVFETMLIST